MIKIVMILLGFLWPYLVKLFWFLLAAIGVGAVTYTGVVTGLNYLLDGIVAGEANLPVAVAQIAHAFGADLLIAGAVAGIMTRVAINGLGTVKRLMVRGTS